MKIGILGAMLEEVLAIRERMSISKETNLAGRVYYEGQIENNEVVLTFSRWGKVASASTTTTLIDKFGAEFILFTGVAGAVSEQLNIGDIVIGDGLYQHDMDARPFFDKFQIPLTSNIIFEPKSSDVERTTIAAERFVDKLEGVISKDLLSKYSIFKPKVYVGLIASGDKFINNASNHEDWYFENKEKTTLAVEMEGASVAEVCEEHNIPYVIIRTISDRANHSAAIDFQSFITDIARLYSSGIVDEYLKF